MMKIQFNTNILPIVIPDTYGTNFCMYIADDMWGDFKQLLIDKAEDYISDALSVTNFAAARLKMGEFYSPRKYNFTTDSIEFTLEFDDRMIGVVKNTVDDEFFEYAKKNFGSHSGFISFCPVEEDTFFRALENKNERLDLAIAMYIMWQIDKEIDTEKYQMHYLDDVWDYASANGYEDMEAI